MGRVLDYINNEMSRRVALTAPTHKAVKVLRAHTGSDDMYTTHAYVGMKEEIDRNGNKIYVRDWHRPRTPCEEYQITIVDEASMVVDEVFDELESLVWGGQHVIFVGDKLQIPPVNCENSLPFEKEVQKELGFQISTLDKIVRQAQNNPIIHESMLIRKAVFSPVPGLSYESNVKGLQGVSYAKYDRSLGFMDDVLKQFSSDHFKANPDYVKIIAWTNREVDRYNKLVRAHLFGENLPKILEQDKLVANAPYTVDKKILVRNNEDMEVLSARVISDQVATDTFLNVYETKVSIIGMGDKRSIEIIRILHESSERDFKDMLKLKRAAALLEAKGSYEAKNKWMDFYKLKDRYADVKYSYAITAHKSQGSTYDHAVVMAYDILKNSRVQERNRILYTSTTRPKYTLKIVYNGK